MTATVKTLGGIVLAKLPPRNLIRTRHYLDQARVRGFNERRFLPLLLASADQRWTDDNEGLKCEADAWLPGEGWWRLVLRLASPPDEPWGYWLLVTVHPLDR